MTYVPGESLSNGLPEWSNRWMLGGVLVATLGVAVIGANHLFFETPELALLGASMGGVGALVAVLALLAGFGSHFFARDRVVRKG